MLHLELPHINVLSKVDLLTQYGDLGKNNTLLHNGLSLTHRPLVDFNLEFYTEVQDLSHLGNALSSASPRYAALNMAICELIEDFSLVGFETLAVEVRRPTPPSPSLHTNARKKNKNRTNTRCLI